MSESPNILGTYVDKYGDQQPVHKTRHGLRRLRVSVSPLIEANRAIAPLVSARIRVERLQRGWSLVEMAKRLGWMTGNPKQRVWAIENNNTRREGIRLGTLFQVASVFGLELRDLLPSNEAIAAAMAKQDS